MVMWLDWITQVRCGHKPSSADADHFCSKALLGVAICQVLDHRIGIDHIEAFVTKGQRTTIEDQCLHTGKTMSVILHFGQRNAAAGNLVRMFVQGLELLGECAMGARSSHVENTHRRRRFQQLDEKAELFLARFSMKVGKYLVHRVPKVVGSENRRLSAGVSSRMLR